MSVNKVILVGRTGKDPEVRYMTNGEAVANVTLATSENWKDKSGEKQEKTEWHNLVFYRRLAEIAGEYVKKGAQLYIEGRIQSRKYTTKEGQERYITEIIVDQMQMLGGKAQGSSSGHNEDSSGHSQQSSGHSAAPRPAQSGGGAFDNMDDDIPFMRHGHRGAGVCWRAM